MGVEYEFADDEQGLGRRGFLRGVLMVGLASGASGLAGWMIGKEGGEPAVTVTQVSSGAVPAVTQDACSERVELVAVQSENARLQAELTDALAKVEVLKSELANYQTQAADLSAQLDESQTRVGLLQGLVQLYDQLASLDLDDLVETALQTVLTLIEGALVQIPLLRVGLTAAAEVLDRLDDSLPSIQDGIAWLVGFTDGLADMLQVMEDTLEETVEPVIPYVQKLTDFFSEILGWIPFGVGDRIERGLNGIGGVLTHVPELVRSLGPFVLEPLGRWFDDQDEEVVIKTTLIDPMRKDALEPAGKLAADFQSLGGKVAELASPLRGRLGARRPLQERIAQYKEQHKL